MASELNLKELHLKCKSLDAYFKTTIEEKTTLYANAVKIIGKFPKTSAEANAELFRTRADMIEMTKVLKYEIESSQVLCKYFELIVDALGKVLEYKSKKMSKKSGGAGFKPTGYKVPQKSNQTVTARSANWLRQHAARDPFLQARQQPAQQPQPRQSRAPVSSLVPDFDFSSDIQQQRPAVSSSKLPKGRRSIPLYFMLLTMVTLMSSADAAQSQLFESIQTGYNALQTVATDVVNVVQSGELMDAVKMTYATAGVDLVKATSRSDMLPVPADVFAYGAISTSHSLQRREVLQQKQDALHALTSNALHNPENQAELDKLFKITNAADRNQTDVVASLFQSIQHIQVAYQLESESSERSSTFTETLMGPLKESSGKLAVSQVQAMNTHMSVGDAKTLQSLNEQLKSTYGKSFSDPVGLTAIQQSSHDVSMLHGINGVGDIVFVTKYASLLRGLVPDNDIAAMEDFYSKFQSDLEVKRSEIRDQESLINNDKIKIKDYEDSLNRFTAPITKGQYQELKSNVARMERKLETMKTELENDFVIGKEIKTRFRSMLENMRFGNSGLLEHFHVSTRDQPKVNFNLMLMAICSHQDSPFQRLIGSIGGENTQLGSLFFTMFPTGDSVNLALTGRMSHVKTSAMKCFQKCTSRGGVSDYCETVCLAENEQMVESIVNRAKGLTPFISTIGEVARTVNLFCSARLAANRNEDFKEWKNVVQETVSGLPVVGNGLTYEAYTHLFTLDTIISRTLLDTLKRNEHDNFKHMVTYMSSLVTFPANTPGCLVAKDYFRKYGTGGLTSTSGFDDKTWTDVLGQWFSENKQNVVLTKETLFDLSKSCLSFLSDVERVKVFSDVVVDCVRSGTGLSCSESVLKYTRDSRSASSLIEMTKSFDNLSAPPELNWLIGELGSFGAFFSNFKLLMGSFKYMILVAIIGILSVLMFKFKFVFFAIKQVFSAVLSVAKVPVRVSKYFFKKATELRRAHPDSARPASARLDSARPASARLDSARPVSARPAPPIAYSSTPAAVPAPPSHSVASSPAAVPAPPAPPAAVPAAPSHSAAVPAAPSHSVASSYSSPAAVPAAPAPADLASLEGLNLPDVEISESPPPPPPPISKPQGGGYRSRKRSRAKNRVRARARTRARAKIQKRLKKK